MCTPFLFPAVTGGAFCFMLLLVDVYRADDKALIMANEELLAILKQGVKVWNAWRGRRTRTNIDLAVVQISMAIAT